MGTAILRSSHDVEALIVGMALLLASLLGGTMPQLGIGELERVLDNISQSYYPSFRFSLGSGPSPHDLPFLAIDRLSEIGTTEAVHVVEGFLTTAGRHHLHRDLKQYALLKLGRLRSKPAIDVITTGSNKSGTVAAREMLRITLSPVCGRFQIYCSE